MRTRELAKLSGWTEPSGDQRSSLVSRAPQRLHDIPSGVKLHRDRALVVQLRELAIDVEVVDLSGAGFVTSGNIGNVNQPT